MTRFLTTVSAIALTASAASAGGIDRSGQPIGVIFEDGTYAEFSLGYADPSVSGVEVVGGTDASGDMAEGYFTLGAAVKHEYSDGLEVALIWDQPFGANVSYPDLTGYYAEGATAELKSNAVTAIVKYGLDENISVYGGVRYQTLEAVASLPFATNYTADGERDDGVGFVLGAAYEIPDIAMRVALTYNSAITHELTTTETGPATLTTTTEVNTPQSINFDFQTGVAADTLLFGSIRWVDWSEFDITPFVFNQGPGNPSLVSYDDDRVSYTLGLGRRLNESWSAAVSAGYEASVGGYSSNLGPTDGYWNLGLGATYTQDNMKVTAGARYVGIGDTQTRGPGGEIANFTDNSAIGVGVKVGFFF